VHLNAQADAEIDFMTEIRFAPVAARRQGGTVNSAVVTEPTALAPRVLIVDDNQTVAHSLANRVRRAGYDTAVFHNGGEALTYCDDHIVAAAIVDIHLPDLSGLILSQGLRQRLGPDRPIIIVSGDTSMETLNSLKHVGATYFFSKPVKSSQLLDQLKGLLE
jgi:DNA-binding response OmpR family regulator